MASKLIMLKKTDEFSSVFSFKQRVSSAFLTVYFKPNLQETRVGFVVAKKVAKLAVDRNYMRRVLRELCRQELGQLLATDIIIQVRKPFVNANFSTIKQELALLLSKVQKKSLQLQAVNA